MPETLRDITRAAVRDRIAAVAIARFDQDGFDAVTVEQLAAEVGISARSFHRYFPAKEDAVIGDPAPHGRYLRDVLAAVPAGQPAWTALRTAFATMVAHPSEDPDLGRRAVRVMTSVPSLRARNLEKHLLWAGLLVPVVAERLRGDDVELRSRALVQAALGCFDVAIGTWAADDDAALVPLLERVFDAVSPTA